MTRTLKTVPTTSDVATFIAALDNPQQQKDSQLLVDIMSKISHQPPVMWGPSIIGFGSYHYTYESGHEGDMPEIGFSPRKGKLALYITYDAEKYSEIRNHLGKHEVSKACLYINKLADVDLDVLKELIQAAYTDSTQK